MYFKHLHGGALFAITDTSARPPETFQFEGHAGGSGPPRAELWEEDPLNWFDPTLDQVLDRDDVVGWYEPGDGIRHACIWNTTGPLYLPALPGGAAGEARKVNRAGDIVGWSEDAAGRHRAVLWRAIAPIGADGEAAMAPLDLGTLGGMSSEANSINGAGQVVGWAEAPDGGRHAFLWTPDGTDGDPANPRMLDLGTLDAPNGVANDINDQEHVVGEILGANGPGFFWSRASGMTCIAGLNANTVRALAVNRNDVVVGTARARSGREDVVFRWVWAAADGGQRQ